MERKMLDLKLQDKIPCTEIRKRTKIIDIMEYTLKQKWKWAGHIARLKDNRWTRRCTEWQPRRGKRSRGRPSRRWQDDITEKEGTTWIRKATDRRQWKTLIEGYILQWMVKALTKTKPYNTTVHYHTTYRPSDKYTSTHYSVSMSCHYLPCEDHVGGQGVKHQSLTSALFLQALTCVYFPETLLSPGQATCEQGHDIPRARRPTDKYTPYKQIKW